MNHLNIEIQKRAIMAFLEESDNILSEEKWKFILSNDFPEMKELLYLYYGRCVSNKISDISTCSMGCQYFPIYVSKLPYQMAVDFLYEQEPIYPDLIKECHLFSAEAILKMAKKGPDYLSTACSLLAADKSSYNTVDLEAMKGLLNYLRTLPDIGKIEEVEGGIFSSRKKKFICSCGHKNDVDSEFCSNCCKNIKGLTYYDLKGIDTFAHKIEVLSDLLK